MKIALDIDDTIINTNEFLLDRMSEFFRVNKNYLIKNNYSYINLKESFKKKEKEFILSMFEKRLDEIELKKNAKKYINKLYNEGNEIYLITARQNFDNVYASTFSQIKKYGIKFTKLICSPNKAEECKKNNIDIYVDDSIKNTNQTQGYVTNIFVFESAHNKNRNTNYSKIKNWKQLYNEIKKIK